MHTGIKRRQVHPLIRFYAEEPRRVSGNQRWFKIVRNLDVPYLSVTTSYVVTTLWHADVDKQVRDRQMPCKRLQPSYRPSANSLTLVPTRTTENIAAGDSQAAVPFPTDGFRSFLFVVTACRNGREAKLPEKGTTEATSCPKGVNMWRY